MRIAPVSAIGLVPRDLPRKPRDDSDRTPPRDVPRDKFDEALEEAVRKV